MRPLSSKEIISIIKKDGWYLARIRGSHWQFKHPTKKGLVTVPHPRKDLDPKLARRIMKQAEIKF